MNTATKRNVEVAAEHIVVTGKNLARLRKCSQAMYYSMLSINMEGMESRLFMRSAVRYMSACLLNGEVDVSAKITEFFDNGYQKDWFETEVEYIVNKEKDLKKVLRMSDYILKKGYKVIAEGLEYKELLNHPISYKSYEIDGIKGKYDLVLEKNGHMTLVTVLSGKPKYSLNTKRKDARPEYSLELLAAQLAGYSRFSDFHAELWYIDGVDDTGKTLPAFELRSGKNIITYSFEEKSLGEVYKHFLTVLFSEPEECGDCDNCFYKSVCRKPVLRMEVEEKKEKSNQNETTVKRTFTDAQNSVIEHVNGPMCVIAVPGAGKTTALVSRMIRLVEKGVKPEKILMITFTKKAAKEIEERVIKLLGRKEHLPVISTYNAFGFSILKENPLYVGGKRIKLADEVDRLSLIYKAVKNSPRIKDMSYSGMRLKYGLIRTLDKMFQEIEENDQNGHDGLALFHKVYDERKDTEGILKVYHMYKRLYKEAGYISFDDQITMVNELFEKYPMLRHRYAERYEYMMVDEYQDTSLEQAEMIYSVAKIHENIVVVGDDDQSIYGWRGGSSEFMLHFPDDFPEAQIVYMEDNFRSNAKILSVAENLISGNGERYDKTLRCHVDGGKKPVYIKGTPGSLVDIVKNALQNGVKPGDICVLARKNKELAEAQMLLEDIVPVSAPKDYMVEDAAFLAVYDMLKLYYEGLDKDEAFYRIMHYMGGEHLLVRKNARESLYQAMINNKKLMPIENTAECMDSYFKSASDECMALGYKILSCFEKIAYSDIRTVVTEIIGTVFNVQHHRVVDSICDMTDEKGITDVNALYVFMKSMILFEVDSRVGYDVSKDAINLITSHDSKGKEFDTVIVYGIERFDMTEEEIRVLYVTVTRAKKNLFLLENSMPEDTELFDKIRANVTVSGGI